MNKDRIQGSVAQAKGKVKEVAGKVTGDAKLETCLLYTSPSPRDS